MRAPLLLATLLVLSLNCFAAVSYKTSLLSSPGNAPTAGAVSGDFNHDGWPDIAFISGQENPSFVTVSLGTGSGNFTSGTSYDIGQFPATIQTADVNNDGNLDLIISYASNAPVSNYLTILLGNGDGTFRNGTDLTFAEPVLGFSVGDVNNDGRVDIVALIGSNGASPTAASLQVELGTGAGTFTPGAKMTMAAGYAGNLALADLNRDGKLDIVNTRTNQILIWLGKGNGTFDAPSYLTPPKVCNGTSCVDSLNSIAIADFNNDSNLDLAVAQAHSCGSACGNNTIYIYKNSGSATFTMSSFTWNADAGIMLLASDVNGDQSMDLVGYSGAPFGGSSEYALNNGNATFGTQTSFELDQPSNVIDRDLNLDSRHDLVATAWQTGNELIAINTGAYTNCAPPSSAKIAAKICTPTSGSSSSPVLVKASGNSPAGVQRLEVWIDGKKQTEAWTDQIAKKFTLTAGTHRIAVVAVDKYEGSAESVVNVTVP